MEIELGDQAESDLEKLPVRMFKRYDDVLDRLEQWPNVSGVKWLTADWKNHARIRLGDYRLIFHLEGTNVIVIDRIAHRKNVYVD